MALVQGRQLGLIEPLHDGQPRSIDEPDVCVSVAVTEAADPVVVALGEILDGIRSGRDITEQCHEHAGMQALPDPIVRARG